MKFIPRMKYCDYENWANFSRLKLHKGWKALGVGCGQGDEVAYLRFSGVEAYGFDNASKRTQVLRVNPKSAEYQINRENFFLADARAIPCKSDRFNLVVCLGVVQHIPESVQVIKEINRVLKNEGRLVVTASNKFGFTLKWLKLALKNLFGLEIGYDYYKLYTQKELVNILKNSGFKIVTTYTTRFIPYRLRSYQHIGEYIVGLLFWLEKNIISKVVILKDIGARIVIIVEKK